MEPMCGYPLFWYVHITVGMADIPLTCAAAWYWPPHFPRDSYTSASVWLFVTLFEVSILAKRQPRRSTDTVTGLLRFFWPSNCVVRSERVTRKLARASFLPVCRKLLRRGRALPRVTIVSA